ncbi:major facilitator superfamily domain-containing protein [Scheffersomyces coipomensis]|uniref:major facilitator superfamily domain-containing protein n=1 Tax=Scheffersomyces coipomensis TaxID=1788519 RepID=UPI00315D4895
MEAKETPLQLKTEEVSSNSEDIEKQVSRPTYSVIPRKRKFFILALVTLAGLLGPISGNIYIPLLPLLQDVFHVSATTINGTVSVFMITFAFAPLLWASWADFGGRKILYSVSLVFFILANILLAVVPANIGALYVLRIVQAFGASSVISLGAGTVADLFSPKDRGKAISIFMIGPQIGPIIGPVLSSIGAKGQWRWIFGFLAIFGFVVYLVLLFFLPETLRYLVGDGECYGNGSWFVVPKLKQEKLVPESERFPKPPRPSIKLIWKLLNYKPVLLCSINGGLLFAAFYAMSISFSRVLKEKYHFSELHVSLSYICPGISLIGGSLLGGWSSDRLCQMLKKKDADTYIPEKRFSLQIVGLIISMAGMVGYGWCIEKQVHVVAVFVFAFLSGFGMTWVFVSNTTYLTECTTGSPATNVAIGNLMRNVAAAISSVIIDKLIKSMGYGWCFTGLAFTYLVGIGFVIILLKYGSKWRHEYSLPRTSK